MSGAELTQAGETSADTTRGRREGLSTYQDQLSSLASELHVNGAMLRQCKASSETRMAVCAARKSEKGRQVEEMRAGLEELISGREDDGARSAVRQSSTGPTWTEVLHQLRENHEHFVDSVRVLAEESRHWRERAHAELLHALRDRRSK
ncbi:uncharacterized protein B0H18DRAFT_972931 [Fomitopsis serialis]|uniref:uncharacterized protein n=1 Tax=Fomitopsis serialis TaxID=139415 RepID=UPI002007AB81|nr:uncharacterized protein B0H18DRAFT_972931 [Neoantrodia serialis]KAH9936229.1 hypothetical protein B0H18DRAFT_972931 [Neoantrodia serialis]